MSRLLPIVFDDKALSGVFILFILPAYLQLAPLPEELCSSGNAADYQWSIGIMGLSPLRGSLRAAPSKKRRKYHYTRHLHRRKQPHHTTVIALRRSLTPFREVLASEAVLLRRSGKIRSTELFSFQGAVKSDLPLFTIPRTKKQLRLLDEQQRLYDERAKLKKEARIIDTMKANVDDFLKPVSEREQEQKRNNQIE